jgi:hypothetical protein
MAGLVILTHPVSRVLEEPFRSKTYEILLDRMASPDPII